MHTSSGQRDSTSPGHAPGGGGAGGPALDEASFSRLFQEHERTLWGIAVAVVRDRTLAQDVVQEAAMITLAKRSEFVPGTSFCAWAGQIVRFTAMNEARKRARAQAASIDDGSRYGSALEPAALRSRSASGNNLDPRLESALDTLDATARECLILRTTMDYSYAAIAAALGIPEGTAMSHVHRARKTLRALLAQSEGSSSAGGGA